MKQKFAICTGASGGIGKSVTQKLADEGYYVFAMALDGLVTVWFRSLVSHYATLASKAKGLMPPRYEWRLRVL